LNKLAVLNQPPQIDRRDTATGKFLGAHHAADLSYEPESMFSFGHDCHPFKYIGLSPYVPTICKHP
jgi:hypothetical protein